MLLLTRQSMRFYQSKFVVINKGRRGVRRGWCYYYTYSLCYQQGTEGGGVYNVGDVITTLIRCAISKGRSVRRGWFYYFTYSLCYQQGTEGDTTWVVSVLHLFVVLSAKDGGGGGGVYVCVYDVGDVNTTLIRCVISKGRKEGGTTWVVSLLHLFVVLSARDGMFKIASINLQLYFTKIYVNRNHIAFKAFTLL